MDCYANILKNIYNINIFRLLVLFLCLLHLSILLWKLCCGINYRPFMFATNPRVIPVFDAIYSLPIFACPQKSDNLLLHLSLFVFLLNLW